MATGSEQAFCERIRTWAENLGFTVYPEIEGWDLVLCAEHEILIDAPANYVGSYTTDLRVPAGAQLGIHAKLVANSEVLAQALGPERARGGTYPALPFVAVPRRSPSFRMLARRLGVGILVPWEDTFVIDTRSNGTPYRAPSDRPPLRLPPIASRAIQAGVPSPRSLSDWRLKALRFLEWARAQNSIVLEDVRRFGLHPSTFAKWLRPVGFGYADGTGKRAVVKLTTYRIREGKSTLPDVGYEGVMEELRRAGKLDPPPTTEDE